MFLVGFLTGLITLPVLYILLAIFYEPINEFFITWTGWKPTEEDHLGKRPPFTKT